MKIKLCGFKEEDSLKVAIQSNVDYIGFVFHEPSPRNISTSQAHNLAKIIPENINKVSVTVDAPLKVLQEIYNSLKPQYIQLHGSENLDYIKNVKENFPEAKIIKALKIKDEKDLNQVKIYENYVDHILLDGESPGSGQSFNWNLIQDFKTKNDFFLSGGLNKDNILDAIKKTNAKIVDISSGIEEVRGKKSPKLIEKITTLIKNIN